MTNEIKTVGALALENLEKDHGVLNAMDIAQEMLKPFDKEVLTALERGRKDWPGVDLFVVVNHRKDKFIPNVIRNFFCVRRTAPTPETEQTVFHYDNKKDDISFLWTIPDKETCRSYYYGRKLVDPEDYDMLKNIMDFMDGKIMDKVKKLNGEIE